MIVYITVDIDRLRGNLYSLKQIHRKRDSSWRKMQEWKDCDLVPSNNGLLSSVFSRMKLRQSSVWYIDSSTVWSAAKSDRVRALCVRNTYVILLSDGHCMRCERITSCSLLLLICSFLDGVTRKICLLAYILSISEYPLWSADHCKINDAACTRRRPFGRWTSVVKYCFRADQWTVRYQSSNTSCIVKKDVIFLQ